MTDTEQIAPCPYCGGECKCDKHDSKHMVSCMCCLYRTRGRSYESNAVDEHNDLARQADVGRKAIKALREHHDDGYMAKRLRDETGITPSTPNGRDNHA